MTEPIANIKTLLIEGSCSLFIQGYRKAKLVSTVKRSMGDIMTSLIPTMWPFLNLFKNRLPQSKHSKAFKYRNFIFTDLFHRYIDIAGIIKGRR